MRWILSFAAVLTAGLFLIPDARAGDCRDVSGFRQGFSGGYVQQQFVQQYIPQQQFVQSGYAVQQIVVPQRQFVYQGRFRSGFRSRNRFRSRFSSRNRFFDSRSNRFGVELFRSRGLFGSRSGFRIGF